MSVSDRFIRLVYEGSAGWWPNLNRERWVEADWRGVSSKYGVRLHFGDALVCEVGVDECSERGILGCGRKGVV